MKKIFLRNTLFEEPFIIGIEIVDYADYEPKARVTNMRSEGFFTYSRGAYTNFLHEERKMRRLFSAHRTYSTHFMRRVEKTNFFQSTSVSSSLIRSDSQRLSTLFVSQYFLIESYEDSP